LGGRTLTVMKCILGVECDYHGGAKKKDSLDDSLCGQVKGRYSEIGNRR